MWNKIYLEKRIIYILFSNIRERVTLYLFHRIYTINYNVKPVPLSLRKSQYKFIYYVH